MCQGAKCNNTSFFAIVSFSIRVPMRFKRSAHMPAASASAAPDQGRLLTGDDACIAGGVALCSVIMRSMRTEREHNESLSEPRCVVDVKDSWQASNALACPRGFDQPPPDRFVCSDEWLGEALKGSKKVDKHKTKPAL